MTAPVLTTPVARPPPPSSSPGRRSGATLFRALLTASWVGIVSYFVLRGLDYYLLPLHERPYSGLHDQFKPTGTIGNRLGIAGTLLLALGVGSYMVRKRWHRLHGLGKLRDWLSFHIWCCTLGPALVVLHTSFRVGGLVAIAFWAMILVVTSGLVGRYVYVRIPKTLNGQFNSIEELDAQRLEALATLRDRGGLSQADIQRVEALCTPTPPRNLLHALALGLRVNAGRRKLERELSALVGPGPSTEPVSRSLLDAARLYHRLAWQRVLLAPFERVFRYWHTVHLPLAIVMLLIVLVHIGVAIAFGYAWTPR